MRTKFEVDRHHMRVRLSLKNAFECPCLIDLNTPARYIHKRAILILGKRLPSILQKLGGEGAGERTGVVMPAKPPFARERAQVGIAFMDCMRVARDVHAPGVSLGEFGELLFPGVEVLAAHALDCPLTLSGLARNLELPRNITRRRLARLIELGLVERVGDHYYWTDRISADAAHDVLLAHLKTLQRAIDTVSNYAKQS